MMGDNNYLSDTNTKPAPPAVVQNKVNLTLLALTQSYNWNGVLERLSQLDPQDAIQECQAVWNRGRTPLHVAVDHDAPLNVVEALLKAYPPSLFLTGTTGMNPLHIACSSANASTDVVKLLLVEAAKLHKAVELCAQPDVDQDTPLHSACRCGASLEVLRLLLLVYPQAVHMRDYEGLTPLHRLWVREFVLLGDETLMNVTGEQSLTGELGEAWKKTTMLLYVNEYGCLKNDPTHPFKPLHCMAKHDCPRRVVRMACQVYPNELLEKDETGMTPLLLACRAPIYKFQDIGYDGTDLEDKLEDHLYEEIENSGNGDSQDDLDQSDRMSIASTDGPKLPSVIDILLQAAPSAATIVSLDGNTPLQIATSTNKTWHQGVGALTEATNGGAALEQNMQDSLKI